MTESREDGPTPQELEQQLEAERAGDPFLVYRVHAGPQLIVSLGDAGGRFTVGRGSAIDISLDWDTNVSRLHAALESIAGYWTVVDDGLSSFGTFLNEERVNGRRRLSDGDILRFGVTTVTFRSPGKKDPQATRMGSI
jgi:pSer/pThr/pTyr-binding forkhead associated (FHA) protein